jgi:diadenosine tetraphosphate (Ap4A) HIT family hydrolase
MSAETMLQDFGFPAFLLVVLGTMTYRSTVYVGRRLFDQHDGIVTIVAKRHVEFLDNLEQSNNAMLTAQQEHSREMTEQTRVLGQLTEHTAILTREIREIE